MTFFSYSVVTAKNTAKAEAKETEMVLTPGIIHFVRIRLPPGSKGLLHLKIMHGGHQFAPTNPGGDFFGDNEIVEWKEWYELKEGEHTLTAVTWNESENYDHLVICQFAVLPEEVLMPFAALRKGVKWWQRLLGGVKTM